MRALGVDLGTVRIGLAMSDAGGVIATPYTVLRRTRSREADHRAIAEICDEWEIDVVVVGLPLSLDGSHTAAARKAAAEATRLGVITNRPVETYDERLTTVTAHQLLREQGVSGPDRREQVDKVAAAVLLQAWLDSRQRNRPDTTPDDSRETP
jgi:putative holliday junction resolvase